MGMKYALGSLASDRFGRYIVTIIFDMFFTVILFKHGYAALVHTAGFSKNGREWIANAVVSSSIGVLTFVVYANMTRFECAWANNPNPWANNPNPNPNLQVGLPLGRGAGPRAGCPHPEPSPNPKPNMNPNPSPNLQP